MKKLIIILVLTAFNQLLSAQTDLYFRIKKLLTETHPEINMDERLLAFNIWSANDPESREANKHFDRVYKIYEYARLKGGTRGIVVISFNKENLSGMATITQDRDGIEKLIRFKLDDLGNFARTPVHNLIFDSKGAEVYKDLPADKIFGAVNQLITR